MKKIIIGIFLITFILINYNCISIADTDELIKSQMQSLNISNFTNEANKYTNEAFPEIDAREII